jgi:hypothetical protein
MAFYLCLEYAVAGGMISWIKGGRLRMDDENAEKGRWTIVLVFLVFFSYSTFRS